jgi:hypothetical protein
VHAPLPHVMSYTSPLRVLLTTPSGVGIGILHYTPEEPWPSFRARAAAAFGFKDCSVRYDWNKVPLHIGDSATMADVLARVGGAEYFRRAHVLPPLHLDDSSLADLDVDVDDPLEVEEEGEDEEDGEDEEEGEDEEGWVLRESCGIDRAMRRADLPTRRARAGIVAATRAACIELREQREHLLRQVERMTRMLHEYEARLDTYA